jgi:hypothetical protein
LDGLLVAAWFFVCALIVYVAGLATIAAPLWALLHACRARSWPAAVLLGSVLNGGAVCLFFSAMAYVPPFPWEWVAAYTAIGGIVGFVIWRTAYRPAVPPAEDVA